MLNGVSAASIYHQHGNYQLPLFYAFGAFAATLSILKVKTFDWTWFETMVTVLVVACIIISKTSGAYAANIASTVAFVIATMPLVIKCYQKPKEGAFFSFLGFLIANVFSTIGGKEWSVPERLYPATCAFLCFVILVLIARKFWMKPELGDAR